MLLIVAALLTGALGLPGSASAQVAPADSAAVLLAAAVEFEDRGEAQVAAALYRHILERFPATAAAETARARLGGDLATADQPSGETELQVWSTIHGIWLGVAIPVAASASEPEAYGAGLLIGTPAGFFLGRNYARSRPLSLGQARAITWGGTWGTFQGLALAQAMNAEVESTFATMIVLGAVGAVAGGGIFGQREVTPGAATSATLGSLWGAWIGLTTSILVDLREERLWGTMAMVGNAGLVAGGLAGSRWPLSRSRARLISVGGLIGTASGFGLALLTDADVEHEGMGAVLAGSVIGLGFGAVLTRGRDLDTGGTPSAAAGALFNRTGGEWSLSTPLPYPVLSPVARPAGPEGRYGRASLAADLTWKVPLLQMRF